MSDQPSLPENSIRGFESASQWLEARAVASKSGQPVTGKQVEQQPGETSSNTIESKSRKHTTNSVAAKNANINVIVNHPPIDHEQLARRLVENTKGLRRRKSGGPSTEDKSGRAVAEGSHHDLVSLAGPGPFAPTAIFLPTTRFGQGGSGRNHLKTAVVLLVLILAIGSMYFIRRYPVEQQVAIPLNQGNQILLSFSHLQSGNWGMPNHSSGAEERTAIHSAIYQIFKTAGALLSVSRGLDCHLKTSNLTAPAVTLHAQSKLILSQAAELDRASMALNSEISASLQTAQTALLRFDSDRAAGILSVIDAAKRLNTIFGGVAAPVNSAMAQVAIAAAEVQVKVESMDAGSVQEAMKAYQASLHETHKPVEFATPTPRAPNLFRYLQRAVFPLPLSSGQQSKAEGAASDTNAVATAEASAAVSKLQEDTRLAQLAFKRAHHNSLGPLSDFRSKISTSQARIMDNMNTMGQFENGKLKAATSAFGKEQAERKTSPGVPPTTQEKPPSSSTGAGPMSDDQAIEYQRFWVEKHLTRMFEDGWNIVGEGRKFRVIVVGSGGQSGEGEGAEGGNAGDTGSE